MIDLRKEMLRTIRWKWSRKGNKGGGDGWTDEELICMGTGVGGGKEGRAKGAKDHSYSQKING